MAARSRKPANRSETPNDPGFIGDKADPLPNRAHTFGGKAEEKANAGAPAEEETVQ